MLNKALLKQVIPIFLYLLLGCISFTWFKDGKYLVGVDTILPFDSDILRETVSVIPGKFGFSGPDIFKLPSLFPYAATFQFLYNIHIPVNSVGFQSLFTYLLFCLSGIFTYFLSRVAFKKHDIISNFMAGFLYMISFYTLFLFTPLPYFLLLSFAFFPLALCLYIDLVNNSKSISRSVLTGFVIFVLLTSSYSTPPYLLIHIGLFISYSFYTFITKPLERTRILKVTFVAISTFVLFNMYWVLPVIFSPKPSLSSISVGGADPYNAYKMNSSQLVDAIRFQGYFGLSSNYKRIPYYNWYEIYKSPFVILLSVLLPFISFLGLKTKNKNDYDFRIYIYFLILNLGFIFLLTFAHLPFGDLLNVALRPFKYFDLFRTAYQRFTSYQVLTYSLMFAYSLSFLREKLSNSPKKYYALLSIFALSNIVLAFPLYTGHLYETNNIFPSKHAELPPVYSELQNTLIALGGDKYNVLVLPFNSLGLYTMDWNNLESGYDGIYPLSHFGTVKTIHFGENVKTLVNLILKNSGFTFGYFGNYMNTKYIVFHRDMNWRFIQSNSWYAGRNPLLIEKKLNSDPCLSKLRDLSSIVIYEMQAKCFTPLVSVVDTNKLNILSSTILNKDIEDLFKSELENSSSVYVVTEKSESSLQIPREYDGIYKGDNYWLNSWNLPGVSIFPNNIAYPFVRLKENYNLLFGKEDKFLYVDKLVWYVTKRFSEASGTKLSDSTKNKFISEINENLSTIQNLYETHDPSDRKEIYFDSLNKSVLYLKKVDDVDLADETNIQATIDNLMLLFPFNSSECRDVCFNLKIPSEATYILNTTTESGSEINPNADIYINNVKQFTNTLKLSEGNYFISYDNVNTEIKLDSTGFAYNGLNYVYPERSQPIPFYKDIPIANWEQLSTYKIKFKYRGTGASLKVWIFEKNLNYQTFKTNKELQEHLNLNKFGDTNIRMSNYLLNNGLLFSPENEWKDIEFEVQSAEDTLSEANLVFLAEPLRASLNYSIEVQDISLSKVPHLQLFVDSGLKQKNNENDYVNSIEQISPFLYKITLNKPLLGTLTFADTFDTGWNLYLPTENLQKSWLETFGNRLFGFRDSPAGLQEISAEHVRYQGISNAWNIAEPIEEKEIYLKYYPQVYIYFGVLLLLCMSFCIFLIVLSILVRKNAKYSKKI